MTFKWGILSKNQEAQYQGWDWAFLDIISNLNPLVIVKKKCLSRLFKDAEEWELPMLSGNGGIALKFGYLLGSLPVYI